VIWGDPHARGFDSQFANHSEDSSVVSIFSHGDFWIVKSAPIGIQGRYGSTQWTQNGQSTTRALAVSGPFLQNHTLIVEPLDGHVTWDGTRVLQDMPSAFAVEGLIDARFFEASAHIDAGLSQRPVTSLEIRLPLGVNLTVNRWSKHLDLRILMEPAPGGQDGHCGNFNGDPQDDHLDQIKRRTHVQVAQNESFFEHPGFAYVGCFVDDREASHRDLPIYIGKGLQLEDCAEACQGSKYFGRQWQQECWCGDVYGSLGQLSDVDCSCDSSDNIGEDRNCVYEQGLVGQVTTASLEDCALDVRLQAGTKCKEEAAKAGTPSTQDVLDACVWDVCFGGEEFAGEDALADQQVQ